MENKGYIFLWRRIMDTSFYSCPNTCHLAIHLLLLANHKEKKILVDGKDVMIGRGQILTGRESLSKKTGLTEREVRTALTHLKTTNFLTIYTTNRYSIVTICKYSDFQNIKTKEKPKESQLNDQPTTSQRPANDQPTTTNNNDKNEKKVKNTTVSPQNGEKRPLTDLQKVVKGWKYLNGIPLSGEDSVSWDKVHFPRCAKSASQLLELFGYPEAVDAMEYVYNELKSKKLDCTLETIVKHSDKYREVMGNGNRHKQSHADMQIIGETINGITSQGK